MNFNIKNNWLVILLISLSTILSISLDFQFSEELTKEVLESGYEVSCEDTVKLPSNFKFIHDRFTAYNPAIDSNTTIKFSEVTKAYKLNTTKTLKWCIGQLLLESRGVQCYEENHKRSGELVISPTGAIGIGQILASTGLDYMDRKIDSSDIKLMVKLGATDFSFAYSKILTKKEKLKLSKEWLSNEVNNLIMWGYIMKDNINNRKDIMSALITYNIGLGGLIEYLELGNEINEHEYIKGIKNRMNYIERLVST